MFSIETEHSVLLKRHPSELNRTAGVTVDYNPQILVRIP